MGRLLLVDDNQTFLYAGRELLTRQRASFIVDTASDAELALFAIRQHEYDVVVSDIRLPGLDGLALLEECHRIQPDTPVVLITGHGDIELEEKAARLGAYAFLHKPVDPDAFYSAVNRAALRAYLRRRPEQVLGVDTQWLPQATEQVRKRSNAITERLRRMIGEEPPTESKP